MSWKTAQIKLDVANYSTASLAYFLSLGKEGRKWVASGTNTKRSTPYIGKGKRRQKLVEDAQKKKANRGIIYIRRTSVYE